MLSAALVFDVRTVFAFLQNEETGEFDITGLANVSWGVIIAVSAIAIVVAAILFVVSSKKKEEQ